ncbi:MAG: hypothetical protein EXR92_02290 [Gemmatimonadetes bacterium]|nr:hypothetical protein [Gemmatimonadota bacterium]
MRTRDRILTSLESAYREAFGKAKEQDDEEGMSRLDFQFQRDQIRLEVLLDIRDLLSANEEAAPQEQASLFKEGSALIAKAQALRRITRLGG